MTTKRPYSPLADREHHKFRVPRGWRDAGRGAEGVEIDGLKVKRERLIWMALVNDTYSPDYTLYVMSGDQPDHWIWTVAPAAGGEVLARGLSSSRLSACRKAELWVFTTEKRSSIWKGVRS